MNMAQLPLAAILYSLLRSIAFLNLILGAVVHDTLFADQQLVTGQTLVSRNQIFEMGFFFPGKSTHRFLGIWYKRTPDVVFWVGNRNNPVSTSQAPVFMISRKGDLAISSGKSIIWSVNSSTVASSPVLQLLDSGNLVLINNNATCIWQSFDYPSDTLLPGMKLVDDKDAGVERYLTSWRNPDDPSPGDIVIKIHNPGLPNIVILRGVTKRYRVGQWNGIYFWGGVDFPNSIFKPEMVFREERLISIGEPYKTLILERITIDSSGALVRHHMNSRKDKWNVATTFPRDSCDEYASCGPNSIRRSDRTVRCQCFRGFAPKFQKDWDLQDLSGGCARVTRVNCHGGDGFLQIRGVKYPDLLSFWVNSTLNLDGCRDECLQNCSCTAYANPFITNGGSGCLLWFDELMDTKALSDAHSKQNIYIRVPLSELENMIGVGGFGPVYKGKMPSGEEIAVKKLSRSSRQGPEEFRNEVMFIAKLQHRNLVRLLGCYIQEEERMLIYEYLENKSLDYFVFDQNRRTLLTWPKRYEIIMGIARGLLYLHHDSRLKIIHRDLKTSNILLDRNLNPKISDFGLARAFEEDQSLAKTKRVVGTYGYMAPEYAIDGKYSVKSDIFSLGVVLLEIISGEKNRGYGDSNHYLNLLGHAWMLWKDDKIVELVDECLNDTFEESQVKRCMQVGLLCVQKFAEDRPTMPSVVSMLGTDGAVLPEPKEPGFFIQRSIVCEQSSTTPNLKSDNEITITDLEAR